MQRYLDFNATCPPLETALEAQLDAARQAYGNPSSLHWAGRHARRLLDDARDALAAYVGAESGSVVFTSGGTEANNLAISGYCATQKPGHIITTAIEHPAVLQPVARLEEAGWQVTRLRPAKSGAISENDVAAALREDTRLVAVMAANNETGVIQPIADIGALCRERNIAFLVDAVQLLGKSKISLRDWQADFISLSAHKIGGPRGVGALIVRRGMSLQEIAPGGGQERKRRSGTENVPGIAGFAAALGGMDFASLARVRDDFETSLSAHMKDVVIFGQDAKRTPNTSMFCIPGLDGETLLMQLDLAGFAVAAGSACSSGKREPSHVLLAMGASQEQARSSLRVSFGPSNTEQDATALVTELGRIRQRLRNMAGAA